jgi:hypothetical protein
MPVVVVTSVMAWEEAVIEHTVTTGHTRLQPADDPRRPNQSFGIACTEPGCGCNFNIHISTFQSENSGTARRLRDYGRTMAAKSKHIQHMLKEAAKRKSLLIKRKTAWDRILTNDE